MQTPISFALEILLDCETIEKAHKACRKYIKALEAKESAFPFNAATSRNAGFPGMVSPIIGPSAQAPSTQRLLEAHAPTINIIPQAPAIPATQRIVGGEVNTGNGTKGPRKF